VTELQDLIEQISVFVNTTASHADKLSRLPAGLIHHDMNVDNLLFTREGQLATVLDFGESCFAPYIVDIARLWQYHCCNDQLKLDETRARAVVGGYCETRLLNDCEQSVLHYCFLISSLSDAFDYLHSLPDAATLPSSQSDSFRMWKANLGLLSRPSGGFKQASGTYSPRTNAPLVEVCEIILIESATAQSP
jgi:Ser/Thr protein kinase RdoA (MazF antagonist)